MRLLLFIVLLFTARLFAQTTAVNVGDYDWIIDDIFNDTHGNHEESAGDARRADGYGNYILNVGDKEKIVPVKIGKKNWGVIKINSDGKVIWRYEHEGFGLGLGWSGDNIIAISGDNVNRMKNANAVLLNAKTGAVIKSKDVYAPDARERIIVQDDPAGVFHNLFIYTVKKELNPKVLAIDKDLSTTGSITLPSSLNADEYAGCAVNKEGEIFMAGFAEEVYTLSRFDKAGKLIKTLSSNIHRRSDYFVSYLQLSDNGQEITCGLNYSPAKKTQVNRIVKFNFLNGKIMTGPEIELEKSILEGGDMQQIKGAKEGKYRDVDQALIIGMFNWKNKTVLISEIRTGFVRGGTGISGDTREYRNDAWFASIYDENGKIEHTAGIDRWTGSFIHSSLSLGYDVKQDQLMVITAALHSAGFTRLTFASMNLTTAKIEKATVIDNSEAGPTSAFEGGATLWFGKNALVEKYEGKLFSQVLKSTWYKVGL